MPATVHVGIVSPLKPLRWENVKESVVVQWDGVSSDTLRQAIANVRNIPARDQIWKTRAPVSKGLVSMLLVTVPRNKMIPPTWDQLRCGQLIRTILELKQEAEQAKDEAAQAGDEARAATARADIWVKTSQTYWDNMMDMAALLDKTNVAATGRRLFRAM